VFTTYTIPIGRIVRKHGLIHHLYADDTQLYIFFDLPDVDDAVRRVEACVAEIAAWMKTNRLMLNGGKTELIFIIRKTQSIPAESKSLLVEDSRVQAVSAARNLGVMFDEHLCMDKQVDAICRSAYFHLSNIGKIRDFLTHRAAEQLVHAFVSSRLDNCNSLLLGIPKVQTDRLQRIQNMAARIVTRTKIRDHITPVLYKLHWLPITHRIQYKVLLLTFKALNGLAPSYLSDLIEPHQPARQLRSAAQHLLIVPRTRLVTVGDRAFMNAAPKLWNGLPIALRSCTILDTFKRQLKTVLFQRAFH
jgi:hypothetical protein